MFLTITHVLSTWLWVWPCAGLWGYRAKWECSPMVQQGKPGVILLPNQRRARGSGRGKVKEAHLIQLRGLEKIREGCVSSEGWSGAGQFKKEGEVIPGSGGSLCEALDMWEGLCGGGTNSSDSGGAGTRHLLTQSEPSGWRWGGEALTPYLLTKKLDTGASLERFKHSCNRNCRFSWSTFKFSLSLGRWDLSDLGPSLLCRAKSWFPLRHPSQEAPHATVR